MRPLNGRWSRPGRMSTGVRTHRANGPNGGWPAGPSREGYEGQLSGGSRMAGRSIRDRVGADQGFFARVKPRTKRTALGSLLGAVSVIGVVLGVTMMSTSAQAADTIPAPAPTSHVGNATTCTGGQHPAGL